MNGERNVDRPRPRKPSRKAIDSENQSMLRRQQTFRTAAEHVAGAFSQADEVEKVVLFGSVSVPLWMEVPRFREFRRSGTEVLHECKDLDLAVWLKDLGCLKRLQRLRAQALNTLFREKNLGVAHFEVEVFILEPATNHYLGRLCNYGECPKGKMDCQTPNCGATLFLKQHEDFVFYDDALERAVVLFERPQGAASRPGIRAPGFPGDP